MEVEPKLKGLRVRYDPTPTLMGVRVWVGRVPFANELPLTGVVAGGGGGAQIIGSPIIQPVGRATV